MSIWLYHYTDVNAAASINSSKLIYQSTDTIKDAVWGQGTYFTDMDPNNHTAEQIAFNNWRRRNLTTVIQQKIQSALRSNLLQEKLKAAQMMVGEYFSIVGM